MGEKIIIGRGASINQVVGLDIKCMKNSVDIKKLKQDIKNSIVQASNASGGIHIKRAWFLLLLKHISI